MTHVCCLFGVCRSKSVSRIPRIVDRSALRYVERQKERKGERKREGPWLQKSSFPKLASNTTENPHQVVDRYRLKASLYCLRNDHHHDASFSITARTIDPRKS